MLTVKIGYPDKWRDYSRAADHRRRPLRRCRALGGLRVAARSAAAERAGRPQRVGHDPADGQRLLQPHQATRSSSRPPSCSRRSSIPTADPAVNYGGIGGVIGHEMTHGFDDQGRKFDGDGRLTDWWTPATTPPASTPRPTRLGAQYSAFEPLPGAHVKGDLTMGENIADLGGLLLGLDAYHASLDGQAGAGDRRPDRRPAGVPRLGPGLARARSATTPCAARLVTDPHSPGGCPGQRRRAQCRRLVRGLRRQAGRQALRRARPAGADLVAGPSAPARPTISAAAAPHCPCRWK